MSKKTERAIELFNTGCNCAQAVFAAFTEETGLTEKVSMKIAAPFGGGMGGSGLVCGALTGALMVFGAISGYTSSVTAEEKKAYTERVRSLMEKFSARNGSLICCELKARNEADIAAGTLSPDVKGCNRYVENAVALVEEYLAAKN